MKLIEAFNAFLLVDRAEQTRSTYQKFLSRFVAAIGPERPLELIRPEDLDAYILEMRRQVITYADHPRRPAKKAKLSKTTVYRNVKMIKTFFTWCLKRGLLDESPARYVVNARPYRPIGQGKAATDDELYLLLDGAQFDRRDRAIVLLLAQSGCRAGEAASLRIQDMEMGSFSALVDGKGDKQRRIYYGEEAARAICAWLEIRPKDAEHDCVFTSTRGHGPLTAQSVSQVVRRLSKKVGLKRSLGAHSLRHRVGQTFGKKRVPVRVAQAYMGHSRPEITFGYYQDVEEGDLRAAGKLLRLDPPAADEDDLREKKKAARIVKKFRRPA